ncbi:MAG: adenine deaminase [Chitinophagaceae bacterium]|nr:adenine deaminase [Chitinophagaceae bacterium]
MERVYIGRLVDVHRRDIYPAEMIVAAGKIKQIRRIESEGPLPYIMPGFIDAHVHIESSMMLPSEFARMAVQHGTVATVSDPHEIANVCGIEGVEYMIQNAKKVPFKFHFGAPSCVPATSFETAGAELNSDAIGKLLASKDIYYLSEMMNYPGVLHQAPEVMKKIALAKQVGKPVDGHAPGLRGEMMTQYIQAGISTDHEAYTYEEGLDKIQAGMKILIREGSAAKNFDALIPLLATYPEHIMFCCDDKHPDELVLHHINHHVQRALEAGYDLFDILQAACVNPVQHYKLPVGLLRVGDPADFIMFNNLSDWQLLETVIDGKIVFDGETKISSVEEEPINQFYARRVEATNFAIAAPNNINHLRVIEALEGQLITRTRLIKPRIESGQILSDTQEDALKIAVVNRYREAPIALGFIHGIGLKEGALASTVAHDSHNIVVVGVDDASIARAVNALMEAEGGICAVRDTETHCLPLPVGGLMSNASAEWIAEQYAKVDRQAKALGTPLKSPFMTLSFMALLVIPQLKMSDLGLFDGQAFNFVSWYE